MTRSVRSLSAALALAVLAGLARADDKPRLALLASDAALEAALSDALQERVTVAPAKAPDGTTAESLAADSAAAGRLARSLNQSGTADLLLLATVKTETQPSELSIVGRSRVRLVLVGGRSGDRLVELSKEGRGSASSEAKARAKALAAGAAEAAKALAESGALALQADGLAVRIEVHGMNASARDAHGLALRKALAAVGAAQAPIDHEGGVLVVNVRTKAVDEEVLHQWFLAALAKEGLGELVKGTDAGRGLLAYRYADPVRELAIRIEGVDPVSQQELGVALTDALRALPGVRAVDRSFDAGEPVLVLKARVAGRLADLDASIARSREGPLALLALLELGEDRLRYRFTRTLAPLNVVFEGLEPTQVPVAAEALAKLVSETPGVRSSERTVDAQGGMVSFKAVFERKPSDLESALYQRIPQVAALGVFDPVVPATGIDVHFRVRQTSARVRVRLERLTEEEHAKVGARFIELLAALERVQLLDKRYDAPGQVLELLVKAPEGIADLDAKVCHAARSVKELAGLAPGDSRRGGLTYSLAAGPTGIAATVLVARLAPEAYAFDGRQVLEALRGLAGATAIDPTYDRDARELSVKLAFPGPAYALEEALWKALEAKKLAPAFTPDRRVGNVVRLVSAERRTERSRVFLRVEAGQDEAARAAATALVAWLKAAPGVTEVEAEPAEAELRARAWSERRPAALHDELVAALASKPELAPLVDGGLQGNLLLARAKNGATASQAAPRPRKPEAPRLADLVERLDPSVVLISGALPTGESWIGTGFFVSPRGFIVTNYHVAGAPEGVPQEAVRLGVKLKDGRKLAATFVRGARENDLAVIRVAGDGYPAVALGDSDTTRPGDSVIVIGNPRGYEHSVTTGIVSAKDRQHGWIQTSALINPGNSGGPAFDEEGRVVGVAVAGSVDRLELGDAKIVIPHPGINFLVPINQALPLVATEKRP